METVLCGDIGGTNANLSLVNIGKDKPEIVDIKEHPTKEIESFPETVNQFLKELNERGYNPKQACFSIAGPINYSENDQYAKMTNREILIDTKDIKKNTNLDKVLLINDFEAISYATNILDSEDLYTLNEGKPLKNGTRAVMGPGTGLGASILYYDSRHKTYIPIPSEGGHSDFVYHYGNEKALAEFIQEKRKRQCHLENEDVITGSGLEMIYEFLSQGRDCPKNLKAMEISTQKKENECAKETYQMFVRLFARCCKNFALQTLCRGGLFIGGGIAAKNYDAFDNFMPEFTKHCREPFADILRNIPVWVITNYDISHLGAAYALLTHT